MKSNKAALVRVHELVTEVDASRIKHELLERSTTSRLLWTRFEQTLIEAQSGPSVSQHAQALLFFDRRSSAEHATPTGQMSSTDIPHVPSEIFSIAKRAAGFVLPVHQDQGARFRGL